MKLYRAKIPIIAHDVIKLLTEEGDIDVLPDNREEAEKDLVAIMEEFSRQDYAFRNRIKDHMADQRLPYDSYGKVRSQMAEETSHPTGNDVERFLTRQIIENLMISNFIDEVYSDDRSIHRKVIAMLRSHHVDEREIREEAQAHIKNVREGTVDYQIALDDAIRQVRKKRGLT